MPREEIEVEYDRWITGFHSNLKLNPSEAPNCVFPRVPNVILGYHKQDWPCYDWFSEIDENDDVKMYCPEILKWSTSIDIHESIDNSSFKILNSRKMPPFLPKSLQQVWFKYEDRINRHLYPSIDHEYVKEAAQIWKTYFKKQPPDIHIIILDSLSRFGFQYRSEQSKKFLEKLMLHKKSIIKQLLLLQFLMVVT